MYLVVNTIDKEWWKHFVGTKNWVAKKIAALWCIVSRWQVIDFKGVARAFPGGRLTHSEHQNEEENDLKMRKNKKNWSQLREKMKKVEVLSTRDWEAGYRPDWFFDTDTKSLICFDDNGRKCKANNCFAYILNGHYNYVSDSVLKVLP